MNVDRLVTLAEFLEMQVDRNHFSMIVWATDDEWDCDTIGCAIGHATRIPMLQLQLRSREKFGRKEIYPWYPGTDELFAKQGHLATRGVCSAALCFDIPMNDAIMLFSASQRIMELEDWRKITPQMQAQRIRNYMQSKPQCVEEFYEHRKATQTGGETGFDPGTEVQHELVERRSWFGLFKRSALLWYDRLCARLGHRNS